MSLPTPGIVRLFIFSLASKCKMLSYCGLNLYISEERDRQAGGSNHWHGSMGISALIV